MKWLPLILTSFLVVTPVDAASFDCGNAQSPVEHIICASSELQILDLKLYEAYSRALRLSSEPKNVRTSQLVWLKDSRNKCTTTDCIARAYDVRIAALDSSIHYKECGGSLSTVGEGYCEGRYTTEAEISIHDLAKLFSSRYSREQVEKFNKIQSEWQKNVACECGQETGEMMGPGDSLNYSKCERKAAEKRLSEIREILAGVHDVRYGASGPSCAEIQTAEQADPANRIIQAITKNDIKAVRKLLSEGNKLPPGDYLYTPLDIAARNNNTNMLAFLLANGAKPNEDIEAMKGALSQCNMNAVILLVDHGYQVTGNPSYYAPYDPLPWAAQFGCRDIVEYLVTNGANVKSYKPLWMAASQCHLETVSYLLDKVQSPDLSNGDNRTPLWAAAITAVNWPNKRSACMAVIKSLIKAGANPTRAFVVPTENPGLKLPKDDTEIMKLLTNSKSKQ